MTKFYLIRHAEAEGNLYRRMHGQMDSMVTPNGKKQILALARRFENIAVDICYTSDLIRTRTTAQAICAPKGLAVQPESTFRELEVGAWEDLTFGYLNNFCPEKMEQFGKDPAHWQVEGSEPFSGYTKRFIDAMNKLGEKHPGKTVAIFSHAAVMRGVIMTLFPETDILPSDNTCVSLLTFENGKYIWCIRMITAICLRKYPQRPETVLWEKDFPKRIICFGFGMVVRIFPVCIRL